LDDYPVVECGSCGLIVEVGELEKETPTEVVFSIGESEDDEDENDGREATGYEPFYFDAYDAE
jgi:hypothetical protein